MACVKSEHSEETEQHDKLRRSFSSRLPVKAVVFSLRKHHAPPKVSIPNILAQYLYSISTYLMKLEMSCLVSGLESNSCSLLTV